MSNYVDEIWKPIIDYEDRYEISNLGNIRSKVNYKSSKFGKHLRPALSQSGYWHITLAKNGTRKNGSVHMLVAITFLGPYPENMQVNHKDGDKSNNRLSNLEYVTRKENIRHSHEVLGNGFNSPPIHYGEKHPISKLTRNKVTEIRELYQSGNYTSRQLGSIYGVSKTNILNIINQKIWR